MYSFNGSIQSISLVCFSGLEIIGACTILNCSNDVTVECQKMAIRSTCVLLLLLLLMRLERVCVQLLLSGNASP